MQHQRSRACKNLLFEIWPAGIGITGRYLVLIQRRDGTDSQNIIMNVCCSNKQKIQQVVISFIRNSFTLLIMESDNNPAKTTDLSIIEQFQ